MKSGSDAEEKGQDQFVARGLASAAAARKSGHYVSACVVLAKLEKRLEDARAVQASPLTATGKLKL